MFSDHSSFKNYAKHPFFPNCEAQKIIYKSLGINIAFLNIEKYCICISSCETAQSSKYNQWGPKITHIISWSGYAGYDFAKMCLGKYTNNCSFYKLHTHTHKDIYIFGPFQVWRETKWMVAVVCKERGKIKNQEKWYFNEINYRIKYQSAVEMDSQNS